MHSVVLRAARADDEDRRADPLASDGLDQLPAVEPWQHQIEHADAGLLVPEPCKTLLAVRHPHRVEPRGGEVAGHSLRDNLVVLDDEHLGHRLIIRCGLWDGR